MSQNQVERREVVRSTGHGQPRSWRWLLDPDCWPGALVLYGVIAGVVCFWRLGATGLVSMEGMVVDGARHMLEAGDWIVPRVYGEVYTYKPALAYWLAAIPMQLAEEPSEWLLRLPFAALGFTMGLAVLLLIGRLASSRTGLISAVASLTGILLLQKSRLMEFDGALAAGVGIAAAAAFYNLAADRQKGGVWVLGYAALAAAFLVKGIPALAVFGPGVLAAGLASGRFRRLLGWRHLSAVMIFLALIAAYLWAAYESAGPKAFEQPMLEAQGRGLGGPRGDDLESQSRADVERFSAQEGELGATPLGAVGLALAKPVLIWAAFLPWTVVLPFGFRRGDLRPGTAGDRLIIAAAAFVGVNALIFMIVPTHETRYFLPLGAPLGILCGLLATRRIEPGGRRGAILAGVSGAVAGLIAVATALTGIFKFSSPPLAEMDRLTIVMIGVAGALSVLYLLRRAPGSAVIPALTIAALCLMVTEYLGVQPYRASKRNLRPEAQKLARYLPAAEPVWVLGPSDEAGKHASLFFYLGRPVRSFRSVDELSRGGSTCLLTSQQVERLTDSRQLVFREIARAEHVWWTYRLGSCIERSHGT